MSDTAVPTKHRQHFDSLQIMRALAALSVFFFHYFGALKTDFGLFSENIFPLGAFGVDIFFVISGFIICFAAQNETIPIRFFIKRLCRILPLYYTLTFGVFAIALIAPTMLNSTTANPENLLRSLLFIPYMKENGMIQPLLFLGWTLNYEMFFYLVFSVAMLFGKHRIPICIALILSLVTFGYIVDTDSIIVNFFTRGIMLNFVWGCAAYMLYRRFPDLPHKLKYLWPVAVIALIVQNFINVDLPREITYGLPSALLLLSLLKTPLPNGSIWNFFKLLGDASYSLYLVHPYILQVVIKLLIPALGIGAISIGVSTILAIAGTVIVSILMYRLLEAPSNKWLRRRLIAPRQ